MSAHKNGDGDGGGYRSVLWSGVHGCPSPDPGSNRNKSLQLFPGRPAGACRRVQQTPRPRGRIPMATQTRTASIIPPAFPWLHLLGSVSPLAEDNVTADENRMPRYFTQYSSFFIFMLHNWTCVYSIPVVLLPSSLCSACLPCPIPYVSLRVQQMPRARVPRHG